MFKDVLKKLREEKGLTQEQLAEKLNVSAGTIGNYEQGQRLPKDDRMWIKIAVFFNVSVDYLMDVDEHIKLIAADTASLPPPIFHTDEVDTTQHHKNMIAERIINSNYSDEELNKIEQMLDIIVPNKK